MHSLETSNKASEVSTYETTVKPSLEPLKESSYLPSLGPSKKPSKVSTYKSIVKPLLKQSKDSKRFPFIINIKESK